MSTTRTARRPAGRHRRTSGAIRQLPSGRWQARYTGPDGLTRPLGTFATKAEADRALAAETVTVARGAWVDPAVGEVLLGPYVHAWIATRDLAPSTRELYTRIARTWIDAEVPGPERAGSRRRVIHLGRRTIGSLTPALIREWDAAVLAESVRRATARWETARNRPRNVNASIRRWATDNSVAIAATGRIPAAVRQAWVTATGGVPDDPRPGYHNAGRTESAQAYRLLRAVLNQAVDDRAIRAIVRCCSTSPSSAHRRPRREIFERG